jgi:small subunit ribosomal protein S20
MATAPGAGGGAATAKKKRPGRHPSAIKRTRRNARRAAINKARVSRLKSSVVKVEQAIAAGDRAKAMEAFKAAQPDIHRSVTKGVLHKNTAARTLSRLNARIKAMQA